ncbi:MAG: MATE family efflux transporter [Planctomycetales bacterium]|nr:MATE family efflux transporter [Planctomycetales bacterium]
MAVYEAERDEAEQLIPPAAAELSALPGPLGGLSVRRQVLTLALWPFLEQTLGFAVGFADTAISGRLSVSATEAIAVGAYLNWLMTLMFGAVGIGAGALVARGIGGRNRGLVRAVVGQALVACIGLGVLMGGVVYAAAPVFCSTMNLVGASWDHGIVYLRVLAWGTPALGIMFVNAACLRSSGNTRTPFFVLTLVNAVNVVTSLLFVFGPQPIGGHGVAGIAAGTVVAYCVGAVAVLLVLIRQRGALRLFRHRLAFDLTTMQRMLRISGPQFFDSLALWGGNFLLATLVGRLGKTIEPGALAAHIVTIRIEALSFMPGWALGQAAAALVGQYLGLGDARRARQAVSYCWAAAAIVMGGLGIAFFCFPRPLIELITHEPSLVEMGSKLLRICGPFQLFLGTAMVMEQSIRGAGDTRPVALLVAFSTFCVRLPLAYLFAFTFGWGVAGIWIGVCLENMLRGSLDSAYFLSGRWSRVHV